MNYSIAFAETFKRAIKKLKQRYPHIQDDIREGVEILLLTPDIGAIIPHSNEVRKLRLRNRDAQRGKSGGYRLLYYLENRESGVITLLFIYSKSDQSDVTARELQSLLDQLAHDQDE